MSACLATFRSVCPATAQVQYGRSERFFAFKRFAVIIVILVADLIFISSSHMVLLFFKAFKDGSFGSLESGVESLVEVLFLLGFMQGGPGWSVVLRQDAKKCFAMYIL